ncbi:hypothetical protein [Amycolatopsis sp. BJA-103]|nr:hypothetical protein [Amycolatopsis sp. BJA-103]
MTTGAGRGIGAAAPSLLEAGGSIVEVDACLQAPNLEPGLPDL